MASAEKEDKKVVVPRSAAAIQRFKLEKLMKNPVSIIIYVVTVAYYKRRKDPRALNMHINGAKLALSPRMKCICLCLCAAQYDILMGLLRFYRPMVVSSVAAIC